MPELRQGEPGRPGLLQLRRVPALGADGLHVPAITPEQAQRPQATAAAEAPPSLPPCSSPRRSLPPSPGTATATATRDPRRPPPPPAPRRVTAPAGAPRESAAPACGPADGAAARPPCRRPSRRRGRDERRAEPATIVLRGADGDSAKGDDAAQAVEPGQRERVLALIRNQSGIVDNYDLRVEGMPEDWWSIYPETVYLVPVRRGRDL